MTIGLITITHNRIGAQITETAETILGPPPFAIRHFAIGPDDDPERMEQQVVQAISKMDTGDGVLIVSDLYGSTPCNIARRVSAAHRIRVVSGINLPMMFRIFGYATTGLDEITRKALDGGRIGVVECDSPEETASHQASGR